MKYYIIIPAYNEETLIAQTLQSIANQTVLPSRVVVVNDNSTDNTQDVVSAFAERYPWLTLVHKQSDTIHMPGSKVIQAFLEGYRHVDDNYDVIVKLDADLILPPKYFEAVLNAFKADDKTGIAGGFAYIEKNSEWILESLTDKDHIRGAFKAYRKECFLQIGTLKPAMGWDTVDELLARFFGWQVVTLPQLKVKHLKPTGASYSKAARYKQGEAFYTIGYGFAITAIASVKLALKKNKPLLFLDYINGFIKAKKSRTLMLVTKEQAAFVKNYRWQKIKQKLF